MRSLILPKSIVHLLALTPLAILLWQMWQVATAGSNALGADPVAEIEHQLGLWALRFLMITLAITPLRQLTGWNVLVRFRRMLGLYAFAYASLHFAAYLGARPHEWRATLWTLGSLVMIGMALVTLWAGLRA